MSNRIICTCDLCGKDIEPVFPVKLGFGKSNYTSRNMYYGEPPNKEELTGDACNSCMRLFIEDVRKHYNLRYNIYE